MKPSLIVRRLLVASSLPAALALILAPVLQAEEPEQDGTWIRNANGLWTDPDNWDEGTIANGAGFTADFTAELTALLTVTLNGNRTIGNILFTDG